MERWALLFMFAGGCFNGCDPEDPCPGHATERYEWALSNCSCPLESDIPWGAEGEACSAEGVTCAGTGYSCSCKQRRWSCFEPDLAVPGATQDLSVLDLSGTD